MPASALVIFRTPIYFITVFSKGSFNNKGPEVISEGLIRPFPYLAGVGDLLFALLLLVLTVAGSGNWQP